MSNTALYTIETSTAAAGEGERSMTKTAKFWTYVNEPTKIKLREGQSLTHVSGGPTDEGYSYEVRTWTFDGEFVVVEGAVKAQDCDGRLDTFIKARCHVSKLRGGYVDREASIVYPVWQAVESSHRDYSAEAMGY
jgi:hypothetical protein